MTITTNSRRRPLLPVSISLAIGRKMILGCGRPCRVSVSPKVGLRSLVEYIRRVVGRTRVANLLSLHLWEFLSRVVIGYWDYPSVPPICANSANTVTLLEDAGQCTSPCACFTSTLGGSGYAVQDDGNQCQPSTVVYILYSINVNEGMWLQRERGSTHERAAGPHPSKKSRVKHRKSITVSVGCTEDPKYK
ncbi:hypothetical protein C8Q73DRAFT_532968 [Cubamyces lactineus]|nr:hypothetical protein C8Q73DRAFT_532968 [Cubamyces lactineus]